jgi:hypothetical protein
MNSKLVLFYIHDAECPCQLHVNTIQIVFGIEDAIHIRDSNINLGQ